LCISNEAVIGMGAIAAGAVLGAVGLIVGIALAIANAVRSGTVEALKHRQQTLSAELAALERREARRAESRAPPLPADALVIPLGVDLVTCPAPSVHHPRTGPGHRRQGGVAGHPAAPTPLERWDFTAPRPDVPRPALQRC
jgi:hypothetical protein